jgi:hypothetical protein
MAINPLKSLKAIGSGRDESKALKFLTLLVTFYLSLETILLVRTCR